MAQKKGELIWTLEGRKRENRAGSFRSQVMPSHDNKRFQDALEKGTQPLVSPVLFHYSCTGQLLGKIKRLKVSKCENRHFHFDIFSPRHNGAGCLQREQQDFNVWSHRDNGN